MGSSVEGQLTYGICFDECFEFPWSEKYGIDINDWWLDTYFDNPIESPFNSRGDWKSGKEDNVLADMFFDARMDFLKRKPVPIEIIRYGHDNYPLIIMSVPNAHLFSDCGEQTKVNPRELSNLNMSEAKKTIKDFCQKHNIENDFDFGWWLTSFWGG